MFEAIRKSTASQKVAEQILKKIHDGELKPGGRLPSQRELAKLFHVGRSSIREAVNALAVMGYIDILQGKGTFVLEEPPPAEPSESHLTAALKAGSIMDLMEARELLERKSAELAAERADAKGVQRLQRALEKMEASGEDYADFLRADIDFHSTLAEIAGNVVICEMMKILVEKVITHHARFKSELISPGYRRNALTSARQVVSSVTRGDGKKAAVWMKVHLDAIRPQLKNVITPGD
ncbi:MAG: FadR family transcriptional regulator [Desulfobacterales bacterium]|nr:FadR family transcriptional regulator [Desulfobacterales bacterium]